MNDYEVIRITTTRKYEVAVVNAYDDEEASEKACARNKWVEISESEFVDLKVSKFDYEDE